jgi:hypothetical protein
VNISQLKLRSEKFNNNNNNNITIIIMKLGYTGAVVTTKICTVQKQKVMGLFLQLLFVNFHGLSSKKTPGWYLVTDHNILVS